MLFNYLNINQLWGHYRFLKIEEKGTFVSLPEIKVLTV